ncbi:hypothetical protein CUJ84_pRLN4000046 (plasmid) [Rhizobium leguminosarum]|uniref:Uncharacterized protein n=1 Tax=Rhizobium leguminosarum TaxID=384 RepID=A0A2K9ZHQ2_RHILE|nr:hypothetical protein CUJ84_pRLN4000046 [Rhizobium leguminosarum]
MSRSFKIGTIGGTAVRVHITFALLLVWIWLAHYRIGGAPAAWEGIAFILSVFACVVLHEFGYIAATRYFGIKTPDITLPPIGDIIRLVQFETESPSTATAPNDRSALNGIEPALANRKAPDRS